MDANAEDIKAALQEKNKREELELQLLKRMYSLTTHEGWKALEEFIALDIESLQERLAMHSHTKDLGDVRHLQGQLYRNTTLLKLKNRIQSLT